jgi:hypothetical protein
MSKVVNVETFAELIHSLLKSDRDVNMAVGGMTGEGKSTFSAKVQKAYAKISGDNWSFERMTWSRKELMRWIDGEGANKEGQLPEYSAILPDELFLMFYSRQWYEKEQIDSIATFNMCRDRHLFLAGNVPNFWELDSAFRERMRFYAYIPERGVAWVFQQENNPFCKDQWNITENMRFFRKNRGDPSRCPNFVFTVRFDDWDEEEKKDYLAIRNKKRVEAVNQVKEDRTVNHIAQRDKVVGRAFYMLYDMLDVTQEELGEMLGISKPTLAKYMNSAVDSRHKLKDFTTRTKKLFKKET